MNIIFHKLSKEFHRHIILNKSIIKKIYTFVNLVIELLNSNQLHSFIYVSHTRKDDQLTLLYENYIYDHRLLEQDKPDFKNNYKMKFNTQVSIDTKTKRITYKIMNYMINEKELSFLKLRDIEYTCKYKKGCLNDSINSIIDIDNFVSSMIDEKTSSETCLICLNNNKPDMLNLSNMCIRKCKQFVCTECLELCSEQRNGCLKCFICKLDMKHSFAYSKLLLE